MTGEERESNQLTSISLQTDMASIHINPVHESIKHAIDPSSDIEYDHQVIQSSEKHDEVLAKHAYLITFALTASWIINVFLLGAKLFVAILSSSKAVTASLADSAVDLLSQIILAAASWYMSRHSPLYPVGKSRLEALSVIACAFVMSMASVEGKKSL